MSDLREVITEKPWTYLIIGDLDKPFHFPECECNDCETWRASNNRPTRKEVRKMVAHEGCAKAAARV